METSLKPSALFTDGAVLCRRREIRIFGEAADGARVRVVLSGENGRTLAENEGEAVNGKFLVTLPPQEARTGCRLTVSDGETAVAAEDIAVGDVYLAGGQSNMELELRNADEGPEIAASFRDPLIRFFNVPRIAVTGEEQRKAFDAVRWRAAEPGNSEYDSAAAFFFAMKMREKRPDVPVGIIGCYWGGTSVTCWMDVETLNSLGEGKRYLDEYAAQCGEKTMAEYLREEEAFIRGMEEWNRQAEAYRTAHPGCGEKDVEDACGPFPWNPPAGPGSPYRPGGLVDPMLRMAAPAALTAILYYQGEEDAGRTDRYDDLMIAMIRLWRRMFMDAELPFLFVQLPMWIGYGAEDSFRWPLTRLAQAAVRDAVRNTGMICLLDQGEYGNIHPTCKRPVGERLAELAGAMLYGEGKESPRAAGKSVSGNTMTITLTAPAFPRDGKVPALLEIAGADGRFVPARAVVSGNTLRLWAAEVPHPVSARYAWTDYSDAVNLFGENGLPVEPFRV